MFIGLAVPGEPRKHHHHHAADFRSLRTKTVPGFIRSVPWSTDLTSRRDIPRRDSFRTGPTNPAVASSQLVQVGRSDGLKADGLRSQTSRCRTNGSGVWSCATTLCHRARRPLRSRSGRKMGGAISSFPIDGRFVMRPLRRFSHPHQGRMASTRSGVPGRSFA